MTKMASGCRLPLRRLRLWLLRSISKMKPCGRPPKTLPHVWKRRGTTWSWMTGTNGPGSSSRTRTWGESPLESRWERRLPKVPWRSFCARLAKCAMLGSRRSWSILRSCSAGQGKAVPSPGKSRSWDMGTFKATVGFLVIIGAIYVGLQIIPPELSNYSFQDDLRDVAMAGGANSRTTDQQLIEAVIKKGQEHQIVLTSENVTVQHIGTPGLNAVYVAADYSVPVSLPGYSFALHFTPSSGNKGF